MKKKKQHTVPQGYLESWSIPNTHQIYVFDKIKQEPRKSNISDVPTENYFYDVDFSCFLTEEQIQECNLNGFDPSKLDEDQYIENFFANEVEGDFKKILTTIINRVGSMNNWELENCCFISSESKADLSILLAFQLIRVKSARRSILESSDCMTQILRDMNVGEERIKNFTVNKKQSALMHGNMIMDTINIEELAKAFFSLTWILIVNETDILFFTSDHPIGTKGHIHHPFMPMNGIMSKGVEVFFPLSPKYLLLMIDGEYHSQHKKDEKRIKQLNDVNIICHYNECCVSFADRFVFSSDGDFSIIEVLLENHPESLKTPHSIISWGGKEYHPKIV